MSAAAVAVLALVAAGVCVAVGRRMVVGHRRRRWWVVNPQTPEIDFRAAALALAGTRKRGRSSSATIVRAGSDSAVSRIWLGVVGPSNPEASAAAVAKAAGGSLGTAETPPPLVSEGRWYLAYPEAAMDSSVIEQDRRKRRWWRAPDIQQLRPEDYDDSIAEGFAVHADSHLGEGDFFVVSAFPESDGRHCRAVAMTTSESLANSWTDATRILVGGATPSRAVFGLLGSVLVSAFIVVAEIGLLGSRIDLWATRQAMLIAAVGCVVAMVSLVRQVRFPRMLAAVVNHWHLPLYKHIRGKCGLVPSGHLAGWANGGERTAVTALERPAPDPVTEERGAYVGKDCLDRSCYISDRDRQWGVFVSGDPGTGKTTFLLNLLLADVRARANEVMRAILWIETKGEGAARAVATIERGAWRPVVLKASVREGLRLELVDWTNPQRSAQLMTEAVRYAFDYADIHEHSAAVLSAVFKAVLSLPEAASRQLGYPSRPNLLRVAYRLLGGEADTGADQETRNIVRSLGGSEAGTFLSYLPPSTQKRDSEQLLRAPRNKIENLLPAEALFEDDGRPSVGLARLITEHHVSVLDLSPTGTAQVGTDGYTPTTAQRVAAICMFCAWDTIKTHCDSWQSHNRSVSIFSDELSDIARLGDAKSEVIQEMGDQGRSRGVLPVFATQRPGQIPQRTRESVMSFGNRACFRLEHYETAEMMSLDLGEVFTPAEMRSFPVGACAARLRSDGVPQPAFTLHPEDL